MWSFTKKNQQKQSDTLQTANIPEQIDDSYSQFNTVGPSISDELKKSYDYAHFEAMRTGNDDGNYFGQEFDIVGTSSRLKSMYIREPWVYAAASTIARKLANVPFVVADKNNDPIPGHELNLLLDEGNMTQDGLSLNWSGYIDLILGGNFFKVFDESFKIPYHIPLELCNIKFHDDPSKYEKGKSPISGLEIMGDGLQSVGRRFIPWEQVIHHKYPNPYTPFFGLSMILSAARTILLDRHKNEFEMAFYLRGATNAGVIETDQDISRSRMDRLMRTFENAFTGKRNWWRTLFLPKGARWVNSGLTMSEMQHLEGLRENRLTFLAAIGVPPSQVGIVQDVNRATAETQERSFWENTIMPLAYFIAAGWNNSYIIKEKYKDKIKIIPDFSEVEAVNGSMFTRAEKARSMDDVATINEQRYVLGLSPLKETDPRGNMFISEMRATASLSALYGQQSQQSSDDIGPDDGADDEKSVVITNTDDGNGEFRHFHHVEIDNVTGDGKTVDTVGNGPKHDHKVKNFKVELGGDDKHGHGEITPLSIDDIEKAAYKAEAKKSAIDSQERIEKKQSYKYLTAYKNYVELMLDQVKMAIKKGEQIRGTLLTTLDIRRDMFNQAILPILVDTMKLGFDSANRNAKSLSDSLASVEQKSLPINLKAPRFNETDQEAIDVIASRTEDDQRRILIERSLSTFYHFDEANTERIEQLVEDGLREGKTFEKIQESIKKDFNEKYYDQFFTIARTETLIAVSVGLSWNHETLKTVFNTVNKQWIHVGDATVLGGSNQEARNEHALFEDEGQAGVVPSDYVWTNPSTGGKLRYPRDMAGGASDVINCRCNMINVIPNDATSNAQAILRS